MDTSLQNQDKNYFSSLNMDAIGDLSALSEYYELSIVKYNKQGFS